MQANPVLKNIFGFCLWLPLSLSYANNINILQAYQAAKSHDATFLASRAALNAGAEFVPLARAQLLPNAGLSYSRFENNLTSSTQDFLGQTNTTQSSYPSSNLVLSVRQPLYRPQLRMNLEQAEAREAGVFAVASSESVSLGLRVVNGFFAVTLDQLRTEVLASETQMLEQQLLGAQRALQAGQGSQVDVEEVSARVAVAKSEWMAATMQLDASMVELKQLTGLDFEGVASVTPIAGPVGLSKVGLSLDAWLEKALSGNPELDNLRARLNISRLELNKAHAAHLPTLDLLVQLSQQNSDNVTNPNAKYRNRQIGIQFNLPMYSGGGISAQTRQNLALLQEAELQLEAFERRIRSELTREFGALSASKTKLNALHVSVAAAQQTLQAAERGVQAGTRSRLQVIEAQQRLSQTKFELGREQLVFWLALMRLEALAGSLNESTIVELARHIHPQ